MPLLNGGGIGGVTPQHFDDRIDELQGSMDELVTDVSEQVDEMQETLKLVPAACPAPWLESISSASQEDGVKVTYKARFLQGRINSTENWLFAQTKGVMVRYSSEGYPRNRNEGTLAFIDEDLFTVDENGAVTAKTKNAVIVGLTTNTKYYISAFPYSTFNVYNETLNQNNGDNQNLNNTTSCTWSGTKGTLTINVTQDYNYKTLGEITATMTPTAGGEAKTGTRTGAGDIIIAGLDAGQYTLTFSSYDYYTAPATQQVSIIAGQPNFANAQYTILKGLDNYTWNEVGVISQNGDAAGIFGVHQTKNITANNETLTMEIIGINHDTLSNGGKAGLTFATKNLMANTRSYGIGNNSNSPYTYSGIRTWLEGDLFDSIQEDVKNNIKNVNKGFSQSRGGGGGGVVSTKIFLLSQREVTNSDNSAHSGEGDKVYSAFTDASSRIKLMNNGSGSAYSWWTRSTASSGVDGIRSISETGYAKTSDGSSSSLGVCFAFCI